jgi:hypothetical protein
MINAKIGYCLDCPEASPMKPLIAKRCQFHYKIFRSKVNSEKRIAKHPIICANKVSAYRFVSRAKWFKERANDLTGVCAACGSRSCKDDPKYEKFSIAHIFPKAYFPSVELHKDNFIELCFWDLNCHGQYDNQGIETIVGTPAWLIMVKRFHAFEHLLTDEEKTRKFYKKFKQLADENRD